jgi:hypothetical protein
MKPKTVREMMTNEAGQKKFISRRAVFVNLLGTAGHLIKHSFSRFLPTPRPEIAGIPEVLYGVNTP